MARLLSFAIWQQEITNMAEAARLRGSSESEAKYCYLLNM
jgi:hypothetical protein